MRGDDAICGDFFSYIDLEKRIRADHPLRVIRAIANAALKSLPGEFFFCAVKWRRPSSERSQPGPMHVPGPRQLDQFLEDMRAARRNRSFGSFHKGSQCANSATVFQQPASLTSPIRAL
jgi:hypothetical protein